MKILLLGAQGQLGWELSPMLAPLGQLTSLSRTEADLGRLDRLAETVKKIKPDIIVNAAAYTAVDQAEIESGPAFKINGEAPALLAELARETGAWLVHYSTDYVFDGRKNGFYSEDGATSPLNVYGRSTLAGDQAVVRSGCRQLIFRTSWVFGEYGRNFPRTILKLALKEKGLKVVSDQIGCPTSTHFIALATVLSLKPALTDSKEVSGLYNLVCGGQTSWYGFAHHLVEQARAAGWPLRVEADEVRPVATEIGSRPALRPLNSRLSTEKFQRTFQVTPPDWTLYADRLLRAWTAESLVS